ncbi:MAG: LysM peptidoglycan-binding domain-containing protein [Smithellaceae bacterium]|jgi:murein DD-endopeptidase MepM/ murein hydrolase activator NlpD|nr:LysM peptidoglycan-binding domain-containing protein [Smithella sp.]
MMENSTMKSSIYTVQRGDTLTKIANAHQTTPAELARINNLTNMDIIKVGQKLIIKPIASQEAQQEESTEDQAGQLNIKFADALEKPISRMKVWIKTGEQETEYLTDSRGEIPFIEINEPDTPVTIMVQRAAGGKKTISTLTADPWRIVYALLVSPKYATKASQRVHKGEPPRQSEKTDATPPAGTVINTRTSNGHPLQQVFVECPNDENLRLGIFNGKHRKIILEAARKADMQPQAIAALINAEAGKKVNLVLKKVTGKDGKPMIDKKTGKEKTVPKRDTTEWNERSKAQGDSSATGMTQFLDSAWISMALTEGTFLNQWVRGKGWLTTKMVEIEKKKEQKNPKTKKMETVTVKIEKIKPVFVLSNGSLVFSKDDDLLSSLAKILSCKPYMAGRRTASDKNLQELLDMRYDPEHAIHAAVDYAVSNIKGLDKAGYPVNSLNDAEKAKIMYLSHHLGPGDAMCFIENTISEAKAKILLTRQFAANEKGRAEAESRYQKAGNDWVKAHREWLKGFVENNIQITNFMCETEDAPVARDLLVITDDLKK